ncbi:MAG: thioredoxin domain-containing protein [Planctomycetes bacterium]|nr:thioredoxin domain-containing protein [Planctomycetota bacterium]
MIADQPQGSSTPFIKPLPTPKRWLRRIAVVAALLGWWFSYNLVRLSVGVDAADPWLQASCGPAEVDAAPSDCLSVLRSQWGSVRLSREEGGLKIPSATLGMGYFAFLALWYLFVGPPTRDRVQWHIPILVIVGLGALDSLRYTYLMAFVLRRWCEGCSAAHAANGVLLLLTILSWPRRPRPDQARAHPTSSLALATLCTGALAVLLHLTLIILYVFGGQCQFLRGEYTRITNDPAYILWRYEQQPVAALGLRDDEPVFGRDDAPHTLIVFSDFQCPACQVAHQTLEDVVSRHPGDLRIAYRYYPQDPACNPDPKYKRGGHTAACRAARAAEAARVLGGAEIFERMRGVLFVNHAQLEFDRFATWAEELGLDPNVFTQTMESEQAAQAVQCDIELGMQLGLERIPALFLDGRELKYWRQLEVWNALLGPVSPAVSQPTTTSPGQ